MEEGDGTAWCRRLHVEYIGRASPSTEWIELTDYFNAVLLDTVRSRPIVYYFRFAGKALCQVLQETTW